MKGRIIIFKLINIFRMLCTTLVAFVAFPGTHSIETQANTSSAVAAFDLPIAETLIELGVSPVIVTQESSFNFWTGNTYESSHVIESGLPGPNMELLQQVLPSRVLLAPWQANQDVQLSSIAPVHVVDNYPYTVENNVWDGLLKFTYELGEVAEQQQQANHLVQETQARLASLREHVTKGCTPLLFIQLLDERHIRVFGDNSFVHAVSQQLGLCNAWKGATNQWGYAQVGVENLFDTEARLVIIRSYNSAGLEEQIARTALSVSAENLVLLVRGWIARRPPGRLVFCILTIFRLKCKA
ncbi:ABC transporter substrate-binding protein [Halomonas sp. AOP42-D2-25]|uniref:ABC transporter substrate-binding protein n=1 Tax=Halomonas sp. AOP42-D2-25 TaxID=3457666 RepID=UPI004034C200